MMCVCFRFQKIFEENLADERKGTAKQIEEVLKEEQERARVTFKNCWNSVNELVNIVKHVYSYVRQFYVS